MLQNRKGQSMVEFALILPLLLMLLLGIVEATRVIWAFVTVQQAAREAARFAVTGRPYLDMDVDISTQESTCTGENPEPDPFVANVAPWICDEDRSVGPLVAPDGITDFDSVYRNPRVDAIKRKAVDTGRTLAVSQVCFTPDEWNGPCNQVPGAFGVLVQGQVTVKNEDGIIVIRDEPVDDHPGFQGLNVQVNTFYNLQMITPIFDAIMGGTFIRLQGRVQLQNEGLDQAAGIEPPPPISAPSITNPIINENEGGSPLGTLSAENPSLSQSEPLRVQLINYDNTKLYDIFLDFGGTLYKICKNVAITGPTTFKSCSLTNALKGPDFTSTAIVPVANGYTFFSTEAGLTSGTSKVTGPAIDVVAGDQPLIAVDNKFPPNTTIWGAGEVIPVSLRFHDDTLPGGYVVKLFGPDGTEYLSTNHSGDTSVIKWTAPSIGEGVCGALDVDNCIINSFKSTDPSTPIATTTVKINIPKIQLSEPSGAAYQLGEPVDIFLFTHTPFRTYNMQIPTGEPSDLTSLDTNEVGDTFPQKLTWTIPYDCHSNNTVWENGWHTLSSHSTHPDSPGAWMADVDFYIETLPDNPQIVVAGGTTWKAGSTIKIKVLRHEFETKHYLQISNGVDVIDVPIPTGASDNTFLTDTCGVKEVDYTIPKDFEGEYTITSYNYETGASKASVDITVLTIPLIRVLEGDPVMPQQTITISGTNHPPNITYGIYYANKSLRSIRANTDGAFQFSYNLANLPTSPPPDLSIFSNLGAPYILESQTAIGTVASTTLTIQGADLMVTRVEVASVAPLSSTVPITIVVQNLTPVTISQFIDVDFYNMQIPNPDPFGPSYLAGYNFPGDVKFWKKGVGPNESFNINYDLPLDELGQKSLYGYADVSNNVFEGETAGEVANPNNINEAPLLVNCPVTLIQDNFANTSAWDTTIYGDADGIGGGLASASAGGALTLASAGSSTFVSDDMDGGQLLLHQTGEVSAAFGLDVQVKLSHVDVSGVGDWAKAGIEIRDSLASDSPKVTWGVTQNDGTGTQVMQAAYRASGGTTSWVGGPDNWLDNHAINLNSGVPVWLRITREPGSNGAFNFYYKQSTTPPPAPDEDEAQQTYWQDTLAGSITVSGIGESVVVGLFNASYLNDTASTSNFDDFGMAVADPTVCSSGSSEEGPQSFPPLYEVCTQPLQNTSFEISPVEAEWKFSNSDIVAAHPLTKGGVELVVLGERNTGKNSLKAVTLDGSGNPRTPHFYQKFAMSDWVISTTTRFDLDLYRKVDPRGTAEAGDKFNVIVVSDPSNPFSTNLTEPAEVASGSFANWGQKTLALQVKAGVNLESYESQDLYLYFYNNSNAPPTSTCPGGDNRCDTTYYFDDINMTVCTNEPAPSPVQTRITGQLTLRFSNGTSEALPFVKVWAYAQGVVEGEGEVFETFTIQNGEFNFYNLDPGTYTIFAQHNIVQGTEIETLSADTTVELTTLNTDTNPAQAILNLFSLGPLP